MATLEDLTPGAWVKGVLPDALVGIIEARWHGVVELTDRDRQSADCGSAGA